ncbi:GIY-YIG nuclease family protein [Calditrichota bacterium]
MYILECSDGTYYIGSTKDLERRLSEHQNALGSNYTKKRLPIKLVYYEEYPRIDEVFYRKKQIQGWSRKKKKTLIEGRHKDLPVLSKKKDVEFLETSATDPSTCSAAQGLRSEDIE